MWIKSNNIVILIFFIILISSTVCLRAAEKNIVLKGSVDFFGKHQVEGGTDVKMGYSLGSEYHVTPYKNWQYGFGIIHQIPREQLIEGETGKKFSFFSLYGLSEINILPAMAMNPALVLHGGYNFFNGNGFYRGQKELSGGFYTAAGFNVSLHDNVRLELMYKWHRGSVKGDSELKVDYQYFSFALCIIL